MSLMKLIQSALIFSLSSLSSSAEQGEKYGVQTAI